MQAEPASRVGLTQALGRNGCGATAGGLMIKRITLKSLPTATEQEVFDRVCFHLISDTERAPGKESAENPRMLRYMTGDELKSVPSCFMSTFQYWIKRGRKFCWEELCDQ